MMTFAFRLRFHTSHKGMIGGATKDLAFQLPNGRPATLVGKDAEVISESKVFLIVSGGYEKREEALEYGKKVRDAVLFFGVKFSMGVDVGNDDLDGEARNKPRGGWSQHAKDHVLRETGMRLEDDTHGVMVFSEESPVVCPSISCMILVAPKTADFFIEKLHENISSQNVAESQIRLAMELLTASHFESSSRARFLTLVLAAEALLKPDDRSQAVRSLIDQINEAVKKSEIHQEEQDSIIGSLKWLYKDSISLSLRKMANKYLEGKTYDGLRAEKFINTCYKARSKLVHKGIVDDSKHDIGVLAANLQTYLSDMLVTIYTKGD